MPKVAISDSGIAMPGMTVAQKLRRKTKDHENDEADGDGQRHLHVVNRGLDRLGSVADDRELDARRQRGGQRRQPLL